MPRAFGRVRKTWTSGEAGRRRFAKTGAHRRLRLEFASIHETHDPASDGSGITGERSRVLDEDEIAALLPALVRVEPVRKGVPRGEAVARAGLSTLHGPALHVVLLTAARIGAVTAMRWRDVDMDRAGWFKPPVSRRAAGR